MSVVQTSEQDLASDLWLSAPSPLFSLVVDAVVVADTVDDERDRGQRHSATDSGLRVP